MVHTNADPEKYFNLFKKHITGQENNVMLLGIGDALTLKRFIEAMPVANITCVDHSCWTKFIAWKYKERNINVVSVDDTDYVNIVKSLDMKFDKIIMNPPYDKNLHLKILESVMNHITDDGEIVNLSPVRWLQDPLAKYKKNSDYNKFEKSVAQHIESLEVVPAEKAQLLFGGAVFNFDIGLYNISKKNNTCLSFFANSTVDKVVSYNQSHFPNIDKGMLDGWRVRVPIIIGGKSGGSGNRKKTINTLGKLLVFYNGIKDGKAWHEHYVKNQYSKVTEEIPFSIRFESENSAKNFINALYSTFGLWYQHNVFMDVHVHKNQILWLGDTENPRTHLIGYESDWTNEDLCKIFGITGFISDTEAEPDSEWEEILKTMEKYI